MNKLFFTIVFGIATVALLLLTIIIVGYLLRCAFDCVINWLHKRLCGHKDHNDSERNKEHLSKLVTRLLLKLQIKYYVSSFVAITLLLSPFIILSQSCVLSMLPKPMTDDFDLYNLIILTIFVGVISIIIILIVLNLLSCLKRIHMINCTKIKLLAYIHLSNKLETNISRSESKIMEEFDSLINRLSRSLAKSIWSILFSING